MREEDQETNQLHFSPAEHEKNNTPTHSCPHTDRYLFRIAVMDACFHISRYLFTHSCPLSTTR